MGKRRRNKGRVRGDEPLATRRDAFTQRVAANDRRRKQRKFSDDVERDILMMGWVSEPVRAQRGADGPENGHTHVVETAI